MKLTKRMSILLLIVSSAFMTQCGRSQPESAPSTSLARYHVTLVTDQPWTIGEAKGCSFDDENMEMHCFPPTSLQSSKHNYLVDADFDKPVQFDDQNWDTGSKSYLYVISWRFDYVEDC